MTTDHRSELGALLEVLHGADKPFTSVEATYRIWRHNARAQRAQIEENRRNQSAYEAFCDETVPREHEEILRMWLVGDRIREEHCGGSENGAYGVRVGDLWWTWDDRNGAHSNRTNTMIGSSVGHKLLFMLDTTPLLGALKFAVVGRGEVAGRATITARATPRSFERARLGDLHGLGWGADEYVLEVDEERGVLLQVLALRNGEDFQKITTTAITFDPVIPDEVFLFVPPSDEPIHDVGPPTALQHLPLSEAQERAPFTIMTLERLPARWRVKCLFLAGCDQPSSPPQLSLSYRSDDGHESLSLSQCAATARMPEHERVISTQRWEIVVSEGRTIRVTRARLIGSQMQAHVEHLGTSVFLISDTLSREDLIRAAARLKPLDAVSGLY